MGDIRIKNVGIGKTQVALRLFRQDDVGIGDLHRILIEALVHEFLELFKSKRIFGSGIGLGVSIHVVKDMDSQIRTDDGSISRLSCRVKYPFVQWGDQFSLAYVPIKATL